MPHSAAEHVVQLRIDRSPALRATGPLRRSQKDDMQAGQTGLIISSVLEAGAEPKGWHVSGFE